MVSTLVLNGIVQGHSNVKFILICLEFDLDQRAVCIGYPLMVYSYLESSVIYFLLYFVSFCCHLFHERNTSHFSYHIL